MDRKKRILALSLVVFLACCAALFGDSYKVAVMSVPTAETLKSIITAILESSGNAAEIQVVPPARTTVMVANKEVDFSLPMLALKDPAKVKTLNYDYSAAVLYNAAFVLFTNKSKPIDIEELKKGNPKGYKIEVDVSQVDAWEFKGLPSTSIEASLRKVAEGAIDGFIHTQASTDIVLKSASFPAATLKRQLYAQLDTIFPLPKGTRGGKVDLMLQAGIKKIKDSGKFDQIFGPTVKANQYNDWQP